MESEVGTLLHRSRSATIHHDYAPICADLPDRDGRDEQSRSMSPSGRATVARLAHAAAQRGRSSTSPTIAPAIRAVKRGVSIYSKTQVYTAFAGADLTLTVNTALFTPRPHLSVTLHRELPSPDEIALRDDLGLTTVERRRVGAFRPESNRDRRPLACRQAACRFTPHRDFNPQDAYALYAATCSASQLSGTHW